jgi:hypothetical protein
VTGIHSHEAALSVGLMLDRLAYTVKRRLPGLFVFVERVARAVTVLRFGRRIASSLARARVDGAVGGKPAVVRALGPDDLPALERLLGAMPEAHLEFFHPHGFDAKSLRLVLGSRAFMTYGLFIEDAMIAYALLKVSPSGAAFVGRLVTPELAGQGMGKVLARYLYWQAALAGLRAHSTINKNNTASLQSHRANREFRIVSELANGYLLIEFSRTPGDETPPVLDCP